MMCGQKQRFNRWLEKPRRIDIRDVISKTEMEPFMENDERSDNSWSLEFVGNDAQKTESDLERGSANDVRPEAEVKSLVQKPTEIDSEGPPKELAGGRHSIDGVWRRMTAENDFDSEE